MALKLDNLSLAHKGSVVVDDVSLQLEQGQLVALIGPNGAGKSTLLRALFGAHRPVSGTISFQGTAPDTGQHRDWQGAIGYMPQDNSANDGLTTLETVLLGAIEDLTLRLSNAVLRRAAEALDRFGLLDLAQRRIETLSGGQRQLVYFAQVLMRDPKILLLDEPASALDLRHQMLLMSHVRHATRSKHLISVVVLHDLTLAASFADRIVVMDHGHITADGTPKDVLTAELLSRVYGVEGEVQHGADGRVWVHVGKAAQTVHSSS